MEVEVTEKPNREIKLWLGYTAPKTKFALGSNGASELAGRRQAVVTFLAHTPHRSFGHDQLHSAHFLPRYASRRRTLRTTKKRSKPII